MMIDTTQYVKELLSLDNSEEFPTRDESAKLDFEIKVIYGKIKTMSKRLAQMKTHLDSTIKTIFRLNSESDARYDSETASTAVKNMKRKGESQNGS